MDSSVRDESRDFAEISDILWSLRQRLEHTNENEVIVSTGSAEIRALKDVQITTEEECSICLQDVVVAKELPCGHWFHAECLAKWFERRRSCPLCRYELRPEPAAIDVDAASGSWRSFTTWLEYLLLDVSNERTNMDEWEEEEEDATWLEYWSLDFSNERMNMDEGEEEEDVMWLEYWLFNISNEMMNMNEGEEEDGMWLEYWPLNVSNERTDMDEWEVEDEVVVQIRFYESSYRPPAA